MSKAEELLNSLVEAYAAESDPSSDSHIVIGVDRFITVPDELKRIAVQYDHNMRTVTFDCPRYYDGRDMSKMTVYINIRGPKGAPHSYIADNVRVDPSNPSMMHFDWTLRRPVTDVKGNLVFLVCIRKADAEGNEENHWNSELNTDLYISEGMEYEEFKEYPYSDIVTQLLQRMGTVEALANPEAMQGYVNTWLKENGGEALSENQTKADAITRTVDGTMISVDDSSDDPLRGLRIFGKTEQVKTTGAQLAKSVHIYSDVRKYASALSIDFDLQPNTTYTISFVGTVGNVLYLNERLSAYVNIKPTTDRISVTFTTANNIPDGQYIDGEGWLIFKNDIDNANPNKFDNLMLNTGSAALPYEPYSGGVSSPSPDWPQELDSIDNPTVTVCGKNLIKPRGFSAYGYTVTVNDDGSFTVTGAANTTETLYLMVTPYSDVYPLRLHEGVDYFMWYESSNGKPIGTKNLDLHGNPVWSNIDTWNANVPHECDRIVQIYLESKNHEIGDTSLCGTYRIQLEIGNKFTGFEGYKEPKELPISHTLRGIPVALGGNRIDVNGQRWICDEVDFERGVYVQRVIKLDSNEPTNVLVSLKNTKTIKCTCDHLLVGKGNGTGLCDVTSRYEYSTNDLTHYYVEDKAAIIFVPVDYDYVTNPVTVLAQLATPIEIPLSAEELEAFKQLHSNHHSTTVFNDAGAQMELKYNADTKIYIDNIIQSDIDDVPVTDEQIARALADYLEENPISAGSTATIGVAELLAAKWVGSNNLYSQIVTIDGVTENSQVDLTPSVAQLVIFYEKDLTFVTENDGGVVTVYAIGQKPENDYTIQVTITEVRRYEDE